jgi:glycosyltransferase involved in cell wall biosynthesis
LEKKLLTIAIPTWNRANILNIALNYLLPQVQKHMSDIEIIISDNCSDDETQAVVNKYIENYPELELISYIQSINTGYYGNFKKCKELANGKYFWLLSDNEFVGEDVIDKIIIVLKKSKDPSIVFLNDWGEIEKKISTKITYIVEEVDLNQLFVKAGYKLTSISAVIFPNDKKNENEVFNLFQKNLFLGFGLLLSTLSYCKKSYIINGTSLWSKNALISFNVFEAFTIHMDICMKYAIKEKNISTYQVNVLMNSIIKNLTRWHYIKYKLYKKIYNKDFGQLGKIEDLLYKYLAQYSSYNNYLEPFIKIPRFLLFGWFFIYRMRKYLLKRVFR